MLHRGPRTILLHASKTSYLEGALAKHVFSPCSFVELRMMQLRGLLDVPGSEREDGMTLKEWKSDPDTLTV